MSAAPPIRPYRAQDFAGVEALWRLVFPNDPPRNRADRSVPLKLAHDPGGLLVALDEAGGVIGTVMAGYDGHRGWLNSVAVHPDHRGGGLGTALVRAAEARLAAMGCIKVNLQVRAGNAGVTRFYRSLGYGVEELVSMGRMLGE